MVILARHLPYTDILTIYLKKLAKRNILPKQNNDGVATLHSCESLLCVPQNHWHDIWLSTYRYNWGSLVNLIRMSLILRRGMIQIHGTHCQDFAELQGLSSHMYAFSQQAGPEDGKVTRFGFEAAEQKRPEKPLVYWDCQWVLQNSSPMLSQFSGFLPNILPGQHQFS